ncbi:MAG: 16S rRNA (guanine(966)-N(2))-methyltransferase RsmD [Bacilli bacterium]|nr:16S rRNA (guanine(966)-N(2))-methyltransferase RsmD [Bacilli bacterium]
MIKVVGGKYRTRNLEVPPHLEVPSKSIVRTGMMNALSMDLSGSVCLDLFAGSGALGIEALSRGAKFCYFADLDGTSADVIRKNLMTLKENNAKVIHSDFAGVLKNYNDKYDIVFLDPPYAMKDVYKDVPRFLIENDRLSPNGVVVLEYEGEIETPKELFSRVREYHYGRTKVMILWR